MTGAAVRRWWDSPFSAFQTNLREIDAGLDVDRTLDAIDDVGASAWLLNAGGIISNYPTDLDYQTRNPALSQRPSGDLIGDAVGAATARGVRLLCRMDFSKIPVSVAERHPEWCFIDPTGAIQEYNGFVSVCPNGGYYRQCAPAVLGEIVERYAVSGFFSNWFSFNEVGYDGRYRGVCHCAPCAGGFASYAAAYGADAALPTGPDDAGYALWQRFAAECLEELTALLRNRIAELDPDAAFIRGDNADIVWHEANNAVGRPLWPTATAEEVAIAKSWRPSKSVLINAVAFLDMPYRFAAEELSTMRQYAIQTISRGGNPSVYVMGTPDRIEYSGVTGSAEVLRFHREHAELYEGLTPAAEIAVVRPDPLRPQGPVRRQEFEGIVLALRRAGLPIDLIAEEHLADVLDAEQLDFRVLILGDLGELPERTGRAIDEWVGRGGRLLSTGSTGLHTLGHDLACTGIRGRISTRLGDELRNSYVIERSDDAEDGVVRGTPLALFGAYHYVDVDPAAATDHLVLSRAPYGPPEKCYGNRVTQHPGRITARHGEGIAVTVPWTVGAAFRELELSALAEHLSGTVLQLLDGAPRFHVTAPGQVEVTVGRRGTELVVHLINLSGAGRRNFSPPIPQAVELAVTGLVPGSAVDTLVGEASVSDEGVDSIRVTVPRLDTFEVAVFPRAFTTTAASA